MLTLVAPLQKDQCAMAIEIDKTMRAKLPALPNPIVASWQEALRLVIDRGQPWIIGPLDNDPYLTKAGGYPLPAEVAEQLHAISARGARFHRIAIAHEVNPNGAVAGLLPKARHGGLALTPQQAKACLGPAPAAEKSKQLAAAMDKSIRKMLRAAAKGSAAVGAALAAPILAPMMLDPIVFGVVGMGGTPMIDRPAIYYPLAAWKW